MVLPDDAQDEHVKAFRRRWNEDEQIWIRYTAVWHRAHVWYRREEVEGNIPDTPNYVIQQGRGVSYRDPEQPTDAVTVPSKCLPCPVCPEAPKRTRTLTRSR